MDDSASSPESLDVDAILGRQGSIARRLANYEDRPQQLEMARAVSEALANGRHLVAEAGTGTGKSFAYLVPAILHATRNQGSSETTKKDKPRIVISTHTIALQEQLIRKDLPLLNSVIPREFSAVLVKGRNNYMSLRRMENAVGKSVSLFANDIQMRQLRDISKWADETSDGSRSSLPFIPDGSVWDEVQSDSSNCMGRKCSYYDDCFYYRARRRAAHAEILIVNHALFFSDLALRAQGAGFLPEYEAVVFDECHTVEGVASDHLGLRLSSTQLEYSLNKLYNDRTNKGLLVTHDLKRLQTEVFACHAAANEYFADLLDWWEDAGRENGRISKPGVVTERISEPLRCLAGGLVAHAEKLQNESIRKDFTSAAERVRAIADTIVQ